MNTFKVAAAQLNLSQRFSLVLKDMLDYIDRAKKKGVGIICFPETSLFAGTAKNRWALGKLRQRCREKKIWAVVAGRIKEKRHVYNTAFLINDRGIIHGKHKKVHLAECLTPLLKPGSAFKVYDTPFCKIGLAVCWDAAFPDVLHSMAKKGAKLIFCPMYWCFEEWAHRRNPKKFEKKLLQALILTRAFENLAYVVFSNAYDPEQPDLASYSAIAEPHRIVSEVFEKEGMITAEVDLAYLKKVRKKYARDYNKVLSP